MDIKSILSNIFQFAKNNQFRVKLDDKLDLEPIREALADRQNSDELLKSLLVTQNAMLVRDKVEEADKKIEITNKSFEKAKKELNFTREEIEKLDAKVKELNNFKGEKGDSPSLQELRKIIEPLILPPIKGDPGKDYVLTAKDKKEIAKSIKVPIVEKTVETIIEKQPIVTSEIKEVAVTDTSEKIKEKLESLEGDERLDAKAIKNLPKPSFGGGIKRIDGALDTRIIGPTDGQALVWNSSRQVWENSSVSGGSGSPGGSDTQVQFNDGGAFGGDAGLVYNKTTNVLTVGEVIDSGLTESTILSSDGSKQITSLSTATYPSLTELSYLKGVTSAVQTQISAKLSNIVEDTTPQLGGDLDLNGHVVTGLVIGTNIQAYDSDLTTIAGLTATTNNIIQSVSSAWASRTPTQVTATLDAMVGDSGAGGTKGLVPAPATGDATKFLKGDGTWGTPSGSGDVAGPSSATDNAIARYDSTTGKLIQNSRVVITDNGYYEASGTTTGMWNKNFKAFITDLADNQNAQFVFGKSEGGMLSAEFNFYNRTSASDNIIGFGFYGVDQILNLYTDRTVRVSSHFSPISNDGAQLGTTSLNFSDLFLASGGVINWNSGNATLTHSAGLLTSNVPISLGTSNALTCGTVELGHASDTTIARVSAGVISVEGVTIPSISSTNTLTNKRITPRVSSETSSATPTINVDNVDFYSITALATAITSFTTNLSGTPTEAQTLWIAITDNGTARAITWGSSFESSGNVTLPTTTVISTRLDVGFVWNSVSSKWRCVAVA